jgi:molybdopterin synthase sulfur carrier subunit
MPVKVRIPTPLRRLTGGQAELTVSATTVEELLMQLRYDYDALAQQILDDRGEVRSFVNIFVNDEDIRFLQGRSTPLKDGDVVSIIPSIAGGG